jgi:RNA 2',3'-cyclic 3'-phosphodiesterase
VTSEGSLEGSERLRLFCGFRLGNDVLDRIESWQAEHLEGRIVVRDNLHVTLAFLGSRPAADVAKVGSALRAVAQFGLPQFRAARYRETRSVGMLVLEDLTGQATAAAERLHELLHRLGVYVPENRRWLPHLTVLRFREQPRLRPPPPDLGTFSPSEAALYHSVLRSGGAQYQILESVALGG